MIIQIELTDAQVDAIAARVAARIQESPSADGTLSLEEAASRLGVNARTVRRRVDAGLIPRVPGFHSVRIPAIWIEKLLNPK